MGNIIDQLNHPDFSSNPTIESRRRLLTIGLYVQLLSSITGILIGTMIRRNSLLIAMNFLSLFLAISGLIGSSFKQKYYIWVHSLGTFCCLGGLFIYEFIEASVVMNRISDHAEYLYTVPYLVDFLVSGLGIFLLLAILDYGTSAEVPLRESEVVSLADSLCAICGQRESIVKVFPCKHTCVCQECSVGLIKDYSKCPRCRMLIHDLRFN